LWTVETKTVDPIVRVREKRDVELLEQHGNLLGNFSAGDW
jgi:hypothetical protein